jgi:hypothetical protein
MGKIERPPNEAKKDHPLSGQLNGEVPWLDGCREYGRETYLDCPVPLGKCPAETPRLHKGGRPRGSKNRPKSLPDKE